MRIERHVFGNRRGYATLARSPGVTDDQCRTIESIAFRLGQSNSPRSSDPAYQPFFTSELPGNCRRVARIMAGAPDDAGRPTLQIISAILPRKQWDRELYGQISALLNNPSLWQWDGNATVQPAKIQAPPNPSGLPPDSARRILALITKIESSVALGRKVMVSAQDFGLDDISAIEALIPAQARARMNTAFCVPSEQFPATVVALPPERGLGAATFRPNGLPDLLPPYAIGLVKAGLLNGIFPLEYVMSYQGFGNRSGNAQAPELQTTRYEQASNRGPMLIALVALALSVVGPLIGYAIGRTQARNELDAKVTEIQTRFNADKGDIDRRIDGLTDHYALQAELDSSIGSINKQIHTISDQAATRPSTSDVDAIRDELKSAKQELTNATTRQSQDMSGEISKVNADLQVLSDKADKLAQGAPKPIDYEKINSNLPEQFQKYCEGEKFKDFLRTRVDTEIGSKLNDLEVLRANVADLGNQVASLKNPPKQH